MEFFNAANIINLLIGLIVGLVAFLHRRDTAQIKDSINEMKADVKTIENIVVKVQTDTAVNSSELAALGKRVEHVEEAVQDHGKSIAAIQARLSSYK